MVANVTPALSCQQIRPTGAVVSALFALCHFGSFDNAFPDVSDTIAVAGTISDYLNLIGDLTTTRKAVMAMLPLL
jgi:hypothetical protein